MKIYFSYTPKNPFKSHVKLLTLGFDVQLLLFRIHSFVYSGKSKHWKHGLYNKGKNSPHSISSVNQIDHHKKRALSDVNIPLKHHIDSYTLQQYTMLSLHEKP